MPLPSNASELFDFSAAHGGIMLVVLEVGSHVGSRGPRVPRSVAADSQKSLTGKPPQPISWRDTKEVLYVTASEVPSENRSSMLVGPVQWKTDLAMSARSLCLTTPHAFRYRADSERAYVPSCPLALLERVVVRLRADRQRGASAHRRTLPDSERGLRPIGRAPRRAP